MSSDGFEDGNQPAGVYTIFCDNENCYWGVEVYLHAFVDLDTRWR